jgi:hypothetical protein
VDDFVAAAVRAHKAGFAFVDIKHCHGYLGHELLSARSRPGKYGGSFDNRLRFLSSIADGIRANAPGLEIGVRLSAFDMVPFKPGPDDVGVPEVSDDGYGSAFGFTRVGAPATSRTPTRCSRVFRHWGSTGSACRREPVLQPAHPAPGDIPALGRVPSAGGPARRRRAPDRGDCGAQGAPSRAGHHRLRLQLPPGMDSARGGAHHPSRLADAVGLGRLVLSYPDMPADMLAGRPLKTKLLCRTFSDCTTAPRNGLVSAATRWIRSS